jgi:diguanylate cyclase (GGDEF)-like protein
MTLRDTCLRSAASLKRGLSHATEPHILFPTMGALGLLAIWGATLNLVRVERAAAEHAAIVSSREQADTYEAQVVRALREIDQTLKLVKLSYEPTSREGVLQRLKERELLPTDLLFVVSIADGNGNVVASTRPAVTVNVAEEDYFQRQRQRDELSVGRPRPGLRPGEWTLYFSRRLDAAGGAFVGVVVVSVDAAYFVSGYEASTLGEKGVLGLLGTDGVFRARRSGDTLSAGDRTGYTAVVPASSETERTTTLSTNPWDGVRRYTTARELYDFPLAVIVGLSADEQMAGASRHRQAYLWRAFGSSVLLVLVLGLLGRMSQQLATSRKRAVVEHIAHAARVEYLAYHDGLTTLPNRGLFSKLLAQGIHQARRHTRPLAVLFLDLDRFKHINDTLGHEAGDQLLQEVATRLKACLRESDTVARLGGDEFVVLLPELGEKLYAASVAQKILSAVARPFILIGQEFRVTASIGISIYPQDGLDEQTLTKNADIAMYQAKEGGSNAFQFYSEKLTSQSVERLALESGLRQALERGEFELHYQTQRAIPSGRITGVEALLRWQHPDLGPVAPLRFIPVAEETGLIVPIGKWVLRTACAQHVAWRKEGLPRLTMAVNVTPRQFSDEQLLPDLRAVLADTGMDPHLLELEITESLLMAGAAETLGILARIKEAGIRIAVDDFGIGYASLATLDRFPLDTVKIDRSFIQKVLSAGGDNEVTEAIIALGRTLSLTVVAQGVETKEQADFLRHEPCDQFQGFYLNKPLPGDQIAELLRAEATSLSPVLPVVTGA